MAASPGQNRPATAVSVVALADERIEKLFNAVVLSPCLIADDEEHDWGHAEHAGEGAEH
jgi:hypothetical protein